MKKDKNLNNNANAPENEKANKPGAFSRFCSTIARWAQRIFFGGSNELYREKLENESEDVQENDSRFEVEKIESPGKQRFKAFFSNKLALVALVVFVCMFLVMLIGPYFFPLDISYMEESQKNIGPGLNMMSVPSKMKNQVASISSQSKFSVGLSKDGNVYVWGDTEFIAGSVSEIPEEVKNSNIVYAAAGSDHIIAVSDEGKVYGWGLNGLGQYGKLPADNPALQFTCTQAPDIILNGKLNVADIKQVTCGKQVSAIVMNDGSVYMWGNQGNGATNMSQISKLTNIDKIIFTNDTAVALLKDGTFSATSQFDYTYVNVDGVKTRVVLKEYIADIGAKVVDIASAQNSIAVALDNGQILVAGTYANGEDNVPTLAADEKIVSIAGGMKHYTVLTDKGTVYSWGSNAWKQTNVPTDANGTSEIFAGPFQNYAVNENGELVAKWGLKGYFMGTDGFGRDIWTRIVNGGRLTMTIGAIAVIISSIIGVIVGCLAGYFGGWVDMLLMRVAEIVSAIPFLPFALILSIVVSSRGFSEMTRIIMIMVILGLLSWTGLARLVRGQVLAEREKEFVIAAKAMGVKEWKIAFKHILPNVISIIIVSMTLDFAGCMLTESSLSYLGFGVKAPRPTWGNMLDGANNSIIIQNYWWQWVFPSIFLMITTICINIIGDALRDVMDPKSNSGR